MRDYKSFNELLARLEQAVFQMVSREREMRDHVEVLERERTDLLQNKHKLLQQLKNVEVKEEASVVIASVDPANREAAKKLILRMKRELELAIDMFSRV
ncbi:MAG: hypothetical protein ACTTKZ_01645 [Bacteroides sp.]